MIARSFAVTIISLFIFLFSFPGYSSAVSEHSGHGSSPANSNAKGMDTHISGQNETSAGKDTTTDTNVTHPSGQVHSSAHDGGLNQHGANPGAHGANESGSHSQNNSSGHEGHYPGRGESGSNGLEPAKNLLVGGFAGINALIIGTALYLKNKLQRGATV